MVLCAALFAFRLKKWETAVNDYSDGDYLYRVACDRVTNDVIRLVESWGDEVRVSVDPGRLDSQAITDTHQIQLTNRDSTLTVSVDHDAFMDASFFRKLVLHEVNAAIAELHEREQHERKA